MVVSFESHSLPSFGGGGIRTHGRSPYAGFQDQFLQPLGHPSIFKEIKKLSHLRGFVKRYARRLSGIIRKKKIQNLLVFLVFGAMLFTYFGVTYLLPGLHSYSQVLRHSDSRKPDRILRFSRDAWNRLRRNGIPGSLCIFLFSGILCSCRF